MVLHEAAPPLHLTVNLEATGRRDRAIDAIFVSEYIFFDLASRRVELDAVKAKRPHLKSRCELRQGTEGSWK